tara:strand:- start:34995 stop:35369 length:375 start_codon:yes stop_codon:yes gene_type:complete
MNNYKKQQGASMPLVVLFVGMAMIVLTIAFKLYSPFYDHWLLTSVLESFEKEIDLKELSAREIRARFDKRLATNGVRGFVSSQSLSVTKQDGVLSIYVDYEVRVPIFENIDAIITFEESLEKQL